MAITNYECVIGLLKQLPRERKLEELKQLELWFRRKSKTLDNIGSETLLDVIQHCEFVTRQADDVIIHQGEKGHRFYIILRGSVAVLHKESLEDVDLGEEGEARFVDRSTLGNELVTLGEGVTFGEIALINPDCIRTASVVANEKCDLVVIHRDLYNRSVSKVIAREYAEKTSFIDSIPLFSQWSPKFKKYLAASLKKESFPFDCPIVKQGEKAQEMYFIVSGEVKLTVDPEAQQEQFQRFMAKYRDKDKLDQGEVFAEKAYFPQKLLPQIEKYSRVNKLQQRQHHHHHQGGGQYGEGASGGLPQSWSPSSIRQMNEEIKSKKVSLNLCYLGDRQYFGDVEFLLDLPCHHATAVCSTETTVMSLYRSHFDRLFKRRNPSTLYTMAHTLELQLARRVLKPDITSSVPLLKCFVYKLLEQINHSGKKFHTKDEELQYDIPEITYEDVSETKAKLNTDRLKSYTWSEAMNRKEVPLPYKPKRTLSRSGGFGGFGSRRYNSKDSPTAGDRSLRSIATGTRSTNHSMLSNGTDPTCTINGKLGNSTDSLNCITSDLFRTFGSGFRSINGKTMASSFDNGSTQSSKKEKDNEAELERYLVKCKGKLLMQTMSN